MEEKTEIRISFRDENTHMFIEASSGKSGHPPVS